MGCGRLAPIAFCSVGYLSEAEFEQAAATVNAAVAKWRLDAVVLANLLERSRCESERTKREIERGSPLVLALDMSRPRVRISDGARIVEMHAPA